MAEGTDDFAFEPALSFDFNAKQVSATACRALLRIFSMRPLTNPPPPLLQRSRPGAPSSALPAAGERFLVRGGCLARPVCTAGHKFGCAEEGVPGAAQWHPQQDRHVGDRQATTCASVQCCQPADRRKRYVIPRKANCRFYTHRTSSPA